jgi:hypothetical protein
VEEKKIELPEMNQDAPEKTAVTARVPVVEMPTLFQANEMPIAEVKTPAHASDASGQNVDAEPSKPTSEAPAKATSDEWFVPIEPESDGEEDDVMDGDASPRTPLCGTSQVPLNSREFNFDDKIQGKNTTKKHTVEFDLAKLNCCINDLEASLADACAVEHRIKCIRANLKAFARAARPIIIGDAVDDQLALPSKKRKTE